MGKRILWFFIGFLFGILALAGSIVGVAFWAYNNVSVETVEGWTGTEIIGGEDPENVQKMALNELIPFISAFISDADSLTLKRIEGVSGIELPNAIGSLSIDFLKVVPVANIPSTLMDKLVSMSFGEMCNAFGVDLGNSDIVNSLKDLTFDQMSNLGEFYNDIELISILGDVPQDSILYKLSKIKDDITGEERNTKIGELSQRLEQITLGELLGIDDTSPSILIALKDSKLNTLSDDMTSLTVSQVFSDYNSNFLLKNLGDATIIGESSIAHTGNTPLTLMGHMTAAMKKCTIGELSDAGILTAPTGNNSADGNKPWKEYTIEQFFLIISAIL